MANESSKTPEPPADFLVTESGEPIVTEAGARILVNNPKPDNLTPPAEK